MLEKSHCLYPLQFGFRKHHSTNDTLINITKNIGTDLNYGKFACGIFVDLQKAFDTVNHVIRLKKSYFSNRSQFASISEFDSTLKSVSHGVP